MQNITEGHREPIDAVYTWVDDTFPGYAEELRRHAGDGRDLNPNRTRDNLDLIRYSLRSLAKNAPFVRNIYILSCRPQVPHWLDTGHERIRLVHHDQVMAKDILPVFNSFAIVSHLHLLPGLSDRFLYIEDDMLMAKPLAASDFMDAEGRPLVLIKYERRTRRRDELDPAKASGWNLALATAEEALDREFGHRRRHHIIHGPRMIDRALFAEMIERFAPEFEVTRRSRFRANGNVPPEYLYPHFLLESGRGVEAGRELSRRMEGFASIENYLPWTWAQMKLLERRGPLTITLNDSFGSRPNPRVVRYMRARLERWFPEPSPFELPSARL